jgi:hypothetical protein
VLDLDQFIDFWAMETLLRHWDGYAGNTNNYFVYDDPSTQRLTFVPWGADAVFGVEPESVDDPEGPLLRGVLVRRLYGVPALRQRYLTRLRALLDAHFVESDLRAEVTRIDRLVRPLLHPIQASQYSNGLADVRRFIDTRKTVLTRVLASPPASPATGERPSPCMYPVGRFDSVFRTTWGTLAAQNPFGLGTATFDLSLDAGVITYVGAASTAGLDTSGKDGPRVGVNVAAASADGGFAVMGLRLIPQLYPPLPDAGPVPLDLVLRTGVVLEYTGGVIKPVGVLGRGTIEFTGAGTVDGGVVSGHLSAQVLTWPFGAGM